jgi:hypothetical protein
MSGVPVSVRVCDAPPLSRGEIRRYMGQPVRDAETDALLEECLARSLGVLTYRVCFAHCPLAASGDTLSLGFAEVQSADLARHLDGCASVLVFAATLGVGLDRLILRESRRSPAHALCLQAIGTERIEALADRFCADEAARLGPLRPRYSPGYGDLPLSFQTEIFRALDCPRRIGLTLTESLLMSPTKSVTAVVGVESGRDSWI